MHTDPIRWHTDPISWQIKTWKAERPFTFTPNKPGELMKPQAVVAELYEQTKHRDDVVIATGVGQHQMFAAQHYRCLAVRKFVGS